MSSDKMRMRMVSVKIVPRKSSETPMHLSPTRGCPSGSAKLWCLKNASHDKRASNPLSCNMQRGAVSGLHKSLRRLRKKNHNENLRMPARLRKQIYSSATEPSTTSPSMKENTANGRCNVGKTQSKMHKHNGGIPCGRSTHNKFSTRPLGSDLSHRNEQASKQASKTCNLTVWGVIYASRQRF